jgi:glycosyltransferase involved in cell wall biosynthesis
LRIVVVSQNYPRTGSSSDGIFIHRLNRGLVRLGAQITVLQLAQWAPPWPFCNLLDDWRADRERRRSFLSELDGIRIHHPTAIAPRPSRFFHGDHWERDGRALVRYCKRRKELATADVVLSHFLVPDGFHGLRLAQALGVPSVAMAWGDDVHAWPASRDYWRRRLVEVLRRSTTLVACSQALANDGNAWIDEPRSWQVVYGGVDLDRFAPVADPVSYRRGAIPEIPELFAPDAKVLLMLAQPVRAKGYVEMLDAWNTVARQAPDWHLVMAGGNWSELDIPHEIQVRGLIGRAHWLGARQAEAIPDLMRASNGFVLPSHNEGLSLSVLEAMATGLPTIATSVGGHAEAIRSPSDGWLIPPGSVPELVQALQELTSSPAERARRGQAARAAAGRIGSPAENAERLHRVLDETVSEWHAEKRYGVGRRVPA